jgi:hypothetical protein
MVCEFCETTKKIQPATRARKIEMGIEERKVRRQRGGDRVNFS